MVKREVTTPYPLIDADPYAGRVIRYMRPSDSAYIAGGGVLAPALLYAYELADPTKAVRSHLKPALRLTGFLGLVGGFLFAYQRSTLRFWGWTENKREQEMDFAELSKLAREGKPLYGETNETPFIQGVAYRNSVFSQLKFGAVPWFNLAVHPHHGVDTSKYYASAKQEVQQDKKSS
ncbi:NADH-ubiquinone oxidoreductase complex I, 21 kDa subunit-domain-containing protein [Cantharellus anzutake]|uniref:NADH-ubiquinone oxidoreductase complex I, 21 kDa subunit-domain-containing protein n=1 Tax=Cantharellus anzutake TaxID=1750568 RepID=UPI0019052A40|nr:NADH-ubiquinone oxidoreductase complex I, 21 kDa subunit-domain-containing protein [Cantharellus anzutake]KAF8329490.1 NADH-ubiquinone oxidoreductase complex I, 21 kDa subunit-domain-containing protein [Cantharellus anzutake]